MHLGMELRDFSSCVKSSEGEITLELVRPSGIPVKTAWSVGTCDEVFEFRAPTRKRAHPCLPTRRDGDTEDWTRHAYIGGSLVRPCSYALIRVKYDLQTTPPGFQQSPCSQIACPLDQPFFEKEVPHSRYEELKRIVGTTNIESFAEILVSAQDLTTLQRSLHRSYRKERQKRGLDRKCPQMKEKGRLLRGCTTGRTEKGQSIESCEGVTDRTGTGHLELHAWTSFGQQNRLESIEKIPRHDVTSRHPGCRRTRCVPLPWSRKCMKGMCVHGKCVHRKREMDTEWLSDEEEAVCELRMLCCVRRQLLMWRILIHHPWKGIIRSVEVCEISYGPISRLRPLKRYPSYSEDELSLPFFEKVLRFSNLRENVVLSQLSRSCRLRTKQLLQFQCQTKRDFTPDLSAYINVPHVALLYLFIHFFDFAHPLPRANEKCAQEDTRKASPESPRTAGRGDVWNGLLLPECFKSRLSLRRLFLKGRGPKAGCVAVRFGLEEVGVLVQETEAEWARRLLTSLDLIVSVTFSGESSVSTGNYGPAKFHCENSSQRQSSVAATGSGMLNKRAGDDVAFQLTWDRLRDAESPPPSTIIRVRLADHSCIDAHKCTHSTQTERPIETWKNDAD